MPSMLATALFVTYGAGQLLSGCLGDRISPRLLIFGGLLVASVCNILLPIVALSEACGWNMTIISWVIFAILGLTLTMICMLVLRKKGNAGSV